MSKSSSSLGFIVGCIAGAVGLAAVVIIIYLAQDACRKSCRRKVRTQQYYCISIVTSIIHFILLQLSHCGDQLQGSMKAFSVTMYQIYSV